MMRTWSVLLGMAVAATLAGCGGGESKPGGEPPKPAPAAPAPAPQAATPTTVAPTGQAAEGEDDEPAPLLAWADSDTDEGKAPLTIQFTADVEGGKATLALYPPQPGDGHAVIRNTSVWRKDVQQYLSSIGLQPAARKE